MSLLNQMADKYQQLKTGKDIGSDEIPTEIGLGYRKGEGSPAWSSWEGSETFGGSIRKAEER